MRPDEHKRKQRADYKKKHGISSKNTRSKENTTPIKDHSDKGLQEPESPSNADEGDAKQFVRRKIASNWDRYEDLGDSSSEEDNAAKINQRGEDFSLLLQRSVNSDAQFQFQSEKDWEDDSNETSTPQVTPSPLEIDFGSLAASLHCLPLHKRLNISAEYLNPDLSEEYQYSAESELRKQSTESLDNSVKTFTVETNKTKSTLSTEQSQLLGPTVTGTSKHVLVTQPSKDSNSSELFRGTVMVHKEQSTLSTGFTIQQNTENLQTSLKEILQDKTKNIRAKLEVQGDQTNNQHENDELDFLLSLETPKGVRNCCSPAGYDSKEAASSVNVPFSTLPSHINPTKDSGQKTADDLEDWLDSVLG